MVSQNKDRASSESTAGELVGNTRVDTSPADIAREEIVFKSEFFSVDLESERRYTLYGIIMIKKRLNRARIVGNYRTSLRPFLDE